MNATTERKTMNGKPVFTVPAKTVVNFKSQFDKKLLCDGMTFTAGTACAYSCSFCYVDSMMRKQQDWLQKHGVTGDHISHVVRRENAVEILRKQIVSKPEAFRQKRQVIYASPLVDVAANMDLVRETVEICKVILAYTRWDIRLLSKSNLLPKIADGDWGSSALRGESTKRIIYGVSTGTLDDKLAAAFEAGTPLVSKRIQSLHWLQDNGFRTFGMICPSLPQRSYERFAEQMFDAFRGEKCEHVWAEVINVRGDSFTRTEKCLFEAGYHIDAEFLRLVSNDKDQWEQYARDTFEAHAPFYKPGQLRFLQYVNKSNEAYWKSNQARGAVML
jgi:DNA repair photolyase